MNIEEEIIKRALVSLGKSTKEQILLELIKAYPGTYNVVEEMYIKYCVLLSK